MKKVHIHVRGLSDIELVHLNHLLGVLITSDVKVHMYFYKQLQDDIENEMMLSLVQHIPYVYEVSFCFFTPTMATVQLIVSTLHAARSNKKLEWIVLRESPLTDEKVSVLAPELPYIKNVNLRESNITNTGYSMIVDEISGARERGELVLEELNVDPEDEEHVHSLLKRVPQIEIMKSDYTYSDGYKTAIFTISTTG